MGLDRSEEAFRSLVEACPDWVIVNTGERLLYANPAAVRGLGYDDADELLGVSVLELIHTDDHATLRERQRLVFDERTPTPPAEMRIVAKDGTVLTAEVTATPIVYHEQPAAIAFCRDVTDRKRMQGQLMLADRMASVGTLAAGVAHELNNPLAYVMTNLALMREELGRIEPARGLDEEALAGLRELVAESKHGVERMSDIVGDLKTFSRADDERRGAVDLHAVVRSCLNMSWNEIRHRARVDVRLDETPPVEANEGRLGQVVLNLLINAAQAMEEGRVDENRLTIATRTDERGWAVVRIEDTGCGISPEMMSRIFDPFYSTKPPGEGTGLGLSICRNIVTSLGGDIDVQSTPGEGTAFEVRLPPARARRSKTSSSSSRLRAVSSGGDARVLVVDDEPMVGRSLRRTLRGNDVTVLESGREALDAFERGERFDVVLCDLMMPGVSGMEVYETVRERWPEQADRFVFMSGGAFTPRAQQFVAKVDNPQIDKPFAPNELREVVSAMLTGETDG